MKKANRGARPPITANRHPIVAAFLEPSFLGAARCAALGSQADPTALHGRLVRNHEILDTFKGLSVLGFTRLRRRCRSVRGSRRSLCVLRVVVPFGPGRGVRTARRDMATIEIAGVDGPYDVTTATFGDDPTEAIVVTDANLLF